MVRQLEINTDQMIEDCASISYHMRGAITYSECVDLPISHKLKLADYVSKKLEKIRESNHPLAALLM